MLVFSNFLSITMNVFYHTIRAQGAMDFEVMRNNVILECEKSEERITNRSYTLLHGRRGGGGGVICLKHVLYTFVSTTKRILDKLLSLLSVLALKLPIQICACKKAWVLYYQRYILP